MSKPPPCPLAMSPRLTSAATAAYGANVDAMLSNTSSLLAVTKNLLIKNAHPLEMQVSFEEFRRFAVLLPERQLAKERILATWVDSADWMEGVEYRCGQRLISLCSGQLEVMSLYMWPGDADSCRSDFSMLREAKLHPSTCCNRPASRCRDPYAEEGCQR